jgi:hypothetical protein
VTELVHIYSSHLFIYKKIIEIVKKRRSRGIGVMEHARTPFQKFILRRPQATTAFQNLFSLASIKLTHPPL